jgi:hypothetical protein
MQSRGFGSFESASRFCQAFDEQRDYFRYRTDLAPRIKSNERDPSPRP